MSAEHNEHTEVDENGDVIVPDGSGSIPRRNMYAELGDLRNEHPAQVAAAGTEFTPGKSLSAEDRLDLALVPPTAEELAHIARNREARGIAPLRNPAHIRADERRLIQMGRALEGTRLARDFSVPEPPASEAPQPAPPEGHLFDPASPDREVS